MTGGGNINTKNTNLESANPDNTDLLYTESWRHSMKLVMHMWRFYLSHRDAERLCMGNASYAAWKACDGVWGELQPYEREIMTAYHSTTWNTKDAEIRTFAENKGYDMRYVTSTVYKIYRRTAERRGIADPEARNRSRQNRSWQNGPAEQPGDN